MIITILTDSDGFSTRSIHKHSQFDCISLQIRIIWITIVHSSRVKVMGPWSYCLFQPIEKKKTAALLPFNSEERLRKVLFQLEPEELTDTRFAAVKNYAKK
jgi:hypothetical protein